MPNAAEDACQQADAAGGYRERADGRRADRRRDRVAPEEVGQDPREQAWYRPGERANQDRPDGVKVDRQPEHLPDQRAEDDVERDRQRHQDDDARPEETLDLHHRKEIKAGPFPDAARLSPTFWLTTLEFPWRRVCDDPLALQ